MKTDDELVSIERAQSTALAESVQSLLAAEGIESFVDSYAAEDVVAGELYTEFTGVDVMVRRSDAAKARKILEDAHHAGEVLRDLDSSSHGFDDSTA